MKKLIVLLAVLTAGIFTAVALSHEGTPAVSCTAATNTYDKFGTGSNTVNEKVTIDGQTVYSQPFTFTGATATHTIPLVINGSHIVDSSASWNSSDGPGHFDSGPVSVSCSTVTVTTTTPGTTTPGQTTTVTNEHTNTVVNTVTAPPVTTTVVTTVTMPPVTHTVTVTKVKYKTKVIIKHKPPTAKQLCLAGKANGAKWNGHTCEFFGQG